MTDKKSTKTCDNILEFLEENRDQIDRLIKETIVDGMERGMMIEWDGKNYRFGAKCTGNKCSVSIPPTFERIAVFHTHPDYSESPISPSDIFEALRTEVELMCVGQMDKDKNSHTSCLCLDPDNFMDWLMTMTKYGYDWHPFLGSERK